jgi:hypothetical protein
LGYCALYLNLRVINFISLLFLLGKEVYPAIWWESGKWYMEEAKDVYKRMEKWMITRNMQGNE